MYIQQVLFMGKLTAKPKLLFLPTGKPVANFTLAINRKNSSKADFIPCVLWGEEAKGFTDETDKGSEVILKGEFRTTNELKFEVDSYEVRKQQRTRKDDE